MIRLMRWTLKSNMPETTATDISAMRELSPEEMTQVAGGVIATEDMGPPHKTQHTPGRLTPDPRDEQGKIGGAGL